MTSTRHIAWAFVTASLVGAVACSAGMPHPDVSPLPPLGAVEPPTGGSRSDRIAAAELATIRGNTADAVRKLRPEFLRVHDQRTSVSGSATTPSVYVNGRYAGEASVLELIPLAVVLEIRYVDAIAAKSMFGSYCPCDQGVIFVRTAR